MGLTNAVFGIYGGIVLIALPQLLSLRHVPESTIATMTAVMASPGFWTFLVSPVLDVRFSRRGYAVATAMAAAVLMIGALVNLDHLAWVEGLLVAGYFCATLYQSALGGWLSSITKAEQASSLSVWMTIGNIAGGGLMAVTASEVMRLLPLAVAAGVLGVMVVLPTAVFVWMRAPGPDRRLAKESFSQFFGEVMSLLKRREVLIAILIFVAPAATFSLTNFLSGLGEDFHASPHFVAVVADTIGRSNPLAATTYCLVTSAFNIPITYMLFVDGAGYAHSGVAGSYAADASLSLLASVVLGTGLVWYGRRSRHGTTCEAPTSFHS
jgi:PAT family beta-lactamase induction signal transducer AmpG